ncbi:proteasome core particle subunit beta 2, partial [Spiromyces aspiralis]
GHVGANIILGGYDKDGPHLHGVHPHGSVDALPYTTLGSGMLAAMSVFETRWRQDMERDEAIDLVRDAVESGIFNDLGSGSNVDIVVITKGRTEYLRGHSMPNERVQKQASYKYPQGSVAVIKKEIRHFDVVTSTPDVLMYEA